MQYPLSRDEHAAMARYLAGIRKQLQDVSELFSSRYGTSSRIAEMAARTVTSSTALEQELVHLERELSAVDTEMKGVGTTV